MPDIMNVDGTPNTSGDPSQDQPTMTANTPPATGSGQSTGTQTQTQTAAAGSTE
jgi:hypothetical protein